MNHNDPEFNRDKEQDIYSSSGHPQNPESFLDLKETINQNIIGQLAGSSTFFLLGGKGSVAYLYGPPAISDSYVVNFPLCFPPL